MDFIYDLQCPACGTSVEVRERDRLLTCPSCGMQKYMVQDKTACYVLPLHSLQKADELLYLPYFRFKGQLYSWRGKEVQWQILDTTQLGCGGEYLPQSLDQQQNGKVEMLKLKPLGATPAARYFHLTQKIRDIFMKAAHPEDSISSEDAILYHRVFIGETMSLVYLPTYLDNGRLMDGVFNQEILTGVREEMVDKLTTSSRDEWLPCFVDLSCPQCGEKLTGDRESLVFSCAACSSLWVEKGGSFVRVDWQIAEGEGDSLLPFWRIRVECSGLVLKTGADLLRISKHSAVIQDVHEEKQLDFWVPAFGLQPEEFMECAKAVTLSMILGQDENLQGNQTIRESLFPVTLLLAEASQALKTVLAYTVQREKFLSLLPKMNLRAVQAELVYLPFVREEAGLLQKQSGVWVKRD